MIRALAVAFMGLIFIAGIASGVAIDRAWLLEGRHHRPPHPHHEGRRRPPPEAFFERLTERIDLSAAQRDQVSQILDDAQDQAMAILEASRPKLTALGDHTREELLAVFTDAQRTRYLELEAEAGPRPGPPKGPPRPPPPDDGRRPPPPPDHGRPPPPPR